MGGRVCVTDGCPRLEFRMTGYCNIHRENSPAKDNPNFVHRGYCIIEGCKNEPILDSDSNMQDYCVKHLEGKKHDMLQDYVERVEKRHSMDNIVISTGDLDGDYRIIDTVMVFDRDVAGFIKGVDPSVAFELVKEHLRNVAVEKGGDAVINCLFQFRNAITDSGPFASQVFELYAIGTVVKRV